MPSCVLTGLEAVSNGHELRWEAGLGTWLPWLPEESHRILVALTLASLCPNSFIREEFCILVTVRRSIAVFIRVPSTLIKP